MDTLDTCTSVLEPWIDRPIPAPPADDPTAHTPSRVRGMLLGTAIGDALGNTSEGRTPAERRSRHGEIRDYLPNWWADHRAVGAPSDDTQLTFWTLESLLRKGRLAPADVAATFAGDRIFGIGKTVTAFLMAYRRGAAWWEAGQPSAGNGAIMRIAPVILSHLRHLTTALWRDVIAATVLTHRDEAAVATGIGFVGVLAECLRRRKDDIPTPCWWPETFLHYARPVETGAIYLHDGPAGSFRGSLCDRVEQEVLPAVDAGLSTLDAAERWHSGAYLLETVPCVLHILAVHGHQAEEAVVRAVNDTWDNDTVAAVVGAAVGALHGADAFPARWRDGLLGRTREADDGRVQGLIEEALRVFVL